MATTGSVGEIMEKGPDGLRDGHNGIGAVYPMRTAISLVATSELLSPPLDSRKILTKTAAALP